MPVPTVITDLSTTAASNGPAGSDLPSTVDDYMRAVQAIVRTEYNTQQTANATYATLTGSETLTNKTLTAPVVATISNTGTITLPAATTTLVGRDTTDTLTNKTLTSPTITAPTVSTGNITVSGTGQKLSADFTNATVASRMGIQSSTSNGQTVIPILPNGTSTVAGVLISSASDSANAGLLALASGSSTHTFNSTSAGTGSTLPLRITFGGTAAVEFQTDLSTDFAGPIQIIPGASVTPDTNGAVVIEATNNTTLTFKLKGSDGTVRSATLTLS